MKKFIRAIHRYLARRRAAAKRGADNSPNFASFAPDGAQTPVLTNHRTSHLTVLELRFIRTIALRT
ncbi:hypothetical protein [Methanoculleus chikugoensis]|uniref:hypothetical protein n=1 Tax=Methanoculleus chikugoensis TaxID=118126 RepID=UPI0006D246DA|nr:hypothetical protein [Methanoculleus chikugoensis]